jgi:serine/threonine protein kinase
LLAPGDMLGGYRIERHLARGGQSHVYLARRLSDGLRVALKVLRAAGGARQPRIRFDRESHVGLAVDHPHLVKVHEAGQAQGRMYQALELLDGASLDRILTRQGPLPVAAACEVVRQAALGLGRLHVRGLVHRDVKPANILWTRAGRAVLLDLGVVGFVHTRGGRLTGCYHCLGTPGYMAPEQCSDPHAVDFRADLYGLGCTLFCLLTGQPPTGRGGRSPLAALPPNLPQPLLGLLADLLEKNRSRRLLTAEEVALRLAPFAQGPSLARWMRRQRRTWRLRWSA